MPRSRKNNWLSERRLEFIDDTLATIGYFTRSTLTDYFHCDPSLVSFDTTEYILRGGAIEKRIGVKTGKQGVSPYYPANGWEPVTNGSGPMRHAAWIAIGGDAPSANVWLDDRKLDWIDDMFASGVMEPDASTYFKEPSERAMADYLAMPGSLGRKRGSTEARRVAWECWG